MKKKVLGDTLSEIKNAKAMAQYAKIMEWLYTNDNAYDSKTEWRDALNELLREVILGEEPEDCECFDGFTGTGIALVCGDENCKRKK